MSKLKLAGGKGLQVHRPPQEAHSIERERDRASRPVGISGGVMWGAPRLWLHAILKLIIVMTPGPPVAGAGAGVGGWGLGLRAVQVPSSTAIAGGWAGA